MEDDFLDTEKDHLKLQVAARAKLLDENKPPSLSVAFCSPGPREENGILGEPVECDSRYAEMSGGDLEEKKTDDRLPGESLAEFKNRVTDDLPAIGPPRMVVFFEERDSPETPSENVH